MKPARTSARLAVAILILGLAAGTARAQDPPQQQEHTVRRGDTLWDLARRYFDDPFMWRLIAEANPVTVENPHWIYPSERLIIPPLLRTAPADPLGQPVETAVAVEPVVAIETPADTVVMEEATVAVALDLRRPIVAANEYLSAPWLSQSADRIATGRISGMAVQTGDTDRLASALYPQDRVAIEGATAAPGDSLLVIRVGRRIDPSGRVVQPVGLIVVEEAAGGRMTGRMVSQFADARIGDGVMPLAPLPEIGAGQPDEVEAGVEGHLLQFLSEEPLHGTSDLAFVSLGRNAGVGIGDELGVYVPAAAASLPPERVATVRVVRADDGTATVRVLSASSVALRNGLPVRLIRRMP